MRTWEMRKPHVGRAEGTEGERGSGSPRLEKYGRGSTLKETRMVVFVPLDPRRVVMTVAGAERTRGAVS